MKKETTGTNLTALALVSTQSLSKEFVESEKTAPPGRPDNSIVLSPSNGSRKSKRIILTVTALIFTIAICSVALVSDKKSLAQQNPVAKSNVVINTSDQTDPSITKQEEQTKNTRKNWSQFITAQNSNYAYGILGGINNLSVIFTNRSDYLLDEVTAKVMYLKANGKPWKTKYISVFNVAAHSERKQSLPKVNRGKSVQITISKIVSKKMHFNYSPDKKKNSDDPYYME